MPALTGFEGRPLHPGTSLGEQCRRGIVRDKWVTDPSEYYIVQLFFKAKENIVFKYGYNETSEYIRKNLANQ